MKVGSRGRISTFLYPYRRHFGLFMVFVPVIIWYILFVYAPMPGLVIAFKDFKLNKGVWGSEWIGLEKFKFLFRSSEFLRALKNTLILSTYKLAVGFPAPIILALMLNEIRGKWFKKIAQTISYLPHFLSWVVLAGVFQQLLSPSTGAVNKLLNAIGVESIYFLGDVRWARFTMVITDLWKGVGWGTIIYLAAITSIDTEQYEAAVLDGASRFQQMIYVTIPNMLFVITFQLIMSVGGLMNSSFDQIYNMSNDATSKVLNTLGVLTYNKGMVEMDYGFSTAAGLWQNLVSFALIIITNAISKRLSDGEFGIW